MFINHHIKLNKQKQQHVPKLQQGIMNINILVTAASTRSSLNVHQQIKQNKQCKHYLNSISQQQNKH
jgi:hypothetical protein